MSQLTLNRHTLSLYASFIVQIKIKQIVRPLLWVVSDSFSYLNHLFECVTEVRIRLWKSACNHVDIAINKNSFSEHFLFVFLLAYRLHNTNNDFSAAFAGGLPRTWLPRRRVSGRSRFPRRTAKNHSWNAGSRDGDRTHLDPDVARPRRTEPLRPADLRGVSSDGPRGRGLQSGLPVVRAADAPRQNAGRVLRDDPPTDHSQCGRPARDTRARTRRSSGELETPRPFELFQSNIFILK